jgi:hypothetical protein
MPGVLAVILLAIAWVFHAAGFHPAAWLDWTSLALAGLVCMALHLLGVWPALPWRRR